MKKLISAYILSLVFSFMLYIYEPITMYANNMDDFWFDLYIIIGPLLKTFCILFFGLSLLFTIIYFINKKFSSKTMVYNIVLILFFVGFIWMYIHGNFLTGKLPSLDGSAINWNDYTKLEVLSVFILIIISALVIFSCVKLKVDNTIKYIGYTTLVVFVMLLSSFLVTLTTTKSLYEKNVSIVSTTKDINVASSNTNFMILLLDAVDSVMFDEEMMNDDDFKDTFKDFTYYKDTMSVYAFTRESVPQILTGIPNKNEDEFVDYYTKSLNKSKLIDALFDRNYSVNIYDDEIKWNDPKALKTNNLISLDRTINEKDYIKEQTRYNLFKYFPFPLKRFSKIENLDFKRSKVLVSAEAFNWRNSYNYDRFKNQKIQKIDKKVFSFVHLEGAHVPCRVDKYMNEIENGTYQQKLQANLTIINAYLDRLKKSNVYDNSVIIVMSDHGFVLGNELIGRQNPILFIKGVNERHDSMIRSNLPISYMDLDDAYIDLLDGKKSNKLFSDVPEERERIYLLYQYLKENHMVEYVQKGKAWDEDTMEKTGREFNR